jgi:hypothetical protein
LNRATLDPENRLMYGDSLQAPPGYRFDAGVATTFSLDFETALAVPVSLALFAANDRDEMIKQENPIALLEGVERISGRLAVFAEAGQIHAAHAQQSRLCSLLEKVIVEVQAPREGSFHPKIWALRFKPLGEEGDDLLRVLVLSRNLTRDRSWDIAVRLDGRRTRKPKAQNRPLHALLSALPDIAVSAISDPQRNLTLELADDMRFADWDMPDACERFEFAVNGLGGRPWQPLECTRIGVVSPFCDGDALAMLASKARRSAQVLISRPDQLACIAEETLGSFAHVAVLDEMAEREDGEEAVANAFEGLHAKIIVAEHGWETRLTLGSGNATTPAFISGRNVEFFVTFTGKTSKLGSIDSILGANGFGRLTRRYEPGELAAADASERAAERVLLFARRTVARGGLSIRCEADPSEGPGNWRLWLVPPVGGIALAGISHARVWPITRGEGHSRDAQGSLEVGQPLDLGIVSLADVTRFLAIEMQEQATGQTVLFSTGLPIEGLPAERDAAIMRSVINDRKTFLRYLRLLLTALGDPFAAALAAEGSGSGAGWAIAAADDEPLLEELVRALCAKDGRLDAVDRLMTRLSDPNPEGIDPIPDEFRALWQVFRAALGNTSYGQ